MRCRNFRPDITLTCATSNRSMPSLQPRHLPSPLTPIHALLTLIPCDNWQLLFFFFEPWPLLLFELTWYTILGKIPGILALFQTLPHFLLFTLTATFYCSILTQMKWLNWNSIIDQLLPPTFYYSHEVQKRLKRVKKNAVYSYNSVWI